MWQHPFLLLSGALFHIFHLIYYRIKCTAKAYQKVRIIFCCAYLSYLLAYFNGSTDSAIAAYNAGMGNVDGWTQQSTSLHNAITFPETQAYLIRVNNAWVRYKTLYPDRFV